MKISPEEKKKYLLLTEKDFEILEKIKKAECIPDLSNREKMILEFLKTQLEKDWRTPVIKFLEKIMRREFR